MRRLLGITILGACIPACVATPTSEGNKDSTPASYKTDTIKQKEEQKYAQLLAGLQQKNAKQDAQLAISQGNKYLFGYYVGRGGLKIPGIPDSGNVQMGRCKLKTLDGMGDTIFGENHMSYRSALTQYATQFNQLMMPNCR